jgi:hypothetical protein
MTLGSKRDYLYVRGLSMVDGSHFVAISSHLNEEKYAIHLITLDGNALRVEW